MHIIDNFIREKFLGDIKIIFKKYNIEDGTCPLGALYRAEVYNNNFRIDLFNLYKTHYHRNLTIVEILAAKQNLEIERQVINLVKNHININNISLRTHHTINLYLSHLLQKIIDIPESSAQAFFLIKRPE